MALLVCKFDTLNIVRCSHADNRKKFQTTHFLHSISNRGQFQHHFTHSFYTFRPQKRKKDSQLKKLFSLLGSEDLKAVRKHLDEINTNPIKINFVSKRPIVLNLLTAR